MSKRYRTEALAAIHETIDSLCQIGAISKQTMAPFDETCLTAVKLWEPHQIKALREREGVTQALFARYLNVTTSLVSKWERGEKRPSGPALKLLALVEKHGPAAVA